MGAGQAQVGPCVTLPRVRRVASKTTLCAYISLSLLRPSTPHRMSVTPFFLLLLAWPLLAVAAHPPSRHKRSNSPPLGFYDPRNNGGSWLTVRLRLHASFPVRLAEANSFLPLFWSLSSKSTIPSPRALASLSMSSSSRHLTPRSWLTKRVMEDYAITSCMSLLPACQGVQYDGSACFFTPLSPPPSFPRHAHALLIRSFGFAGECLGQHSGSDQEANLGDGHGYRAYSTHLDTAPTYSFLLK